MIRFAILAGVSTDAQAREESSSIPDQVRTCRAKIVQLEGVETCGPFIVDGYSRSGYDSLEVAMREIPPLGEAIQAAHANEYDVLIMDNFDRLGDLAFIVSIRFKKLKKQLYSARQSGKLSEPGEYDPYTTEDVDIHMHASGIVQVYRINKIRRGWNAGIPKRARDGLHPLSLAYGYQRRPGRAPAVQIPEQAALVIRMKDMYLEGRPLQEIVDASNASGTPPPRAAHWTHQTVKRIIHNPYYAGIIEFGREKKDNGQRATQPPSKRLRSEGLHAPLWDQPTYLAILAEAERRAGLRQRSQRYALSGLLTCAVCGQRMDRHGSAPYFYLTCRTSPSCVTVRFERALQLVAATVTDALRDYREQSPPPHPTDWQSLLARQAELRRLVQEGYEAKLYTALEAQERIVAIETEIERLQRQRDRAQQHARQKAALLQFADQDLDRMRRWIIEDNPTTVNHLLTSLCEKITITPTHQLDITWRV